MKSIPRQLTTFAVGSLGVLCFGLAGFAQTPSASPAKTVNQIVPVRGKYFDDLFPPRRKYDPSEPCFGGVKPLASLQTALRSGMVRPTNEVREIDLEGLKKILQRDPKDTRPLLVNFWATWCDPCREEFPDLVKIDADYRAKGLNFVAVSLDDVTDIKGKVEPFLKEMKATMSVVLLNVNDPEPAIHTVDPTWQGDMPATFLYDKDGKVVFKRFGPIKPNELRAAIDKEVGSKQ